jgi:dTDP-4-amino-4,6-dideoxygalactose transaminase
MRTIPFSRPAVGEEEIEAVAAVLRSGWLTTGEQALAFEEEFAAVVETPHAMAVNSATAGLHLALEAVGVGPGDAVILPSMTFTATAEVVRYLGGEVVFADIGANDLLMSPASVAEQAATVRRNGGRVGAIIPVHLAGEACDMQAIREIAREYDTVVVEDAAHAFPGTTKDGYIGTLGDIGVYSFYANKTITTGEGGMVVTGDERFAARIRTMRNHGIDREAWHRYTETSVDSAVRRPWYYEVIAPGYKYNLPTPPQRSAASSSGGRERSATPGERMLVPI